MATTLRQFKPSPAVKSVSVDDNLVLMDQKSGQYFGLNEVGREIWRLLEAGTDATAIVATLATQFDATEEVLAADTHCLLDQLSEAGLTV